ncbi:MAG: hypothetical protein V1817_04840 [Candidatus Micrarchaeota archaeon]
MIELKHFGCTKELLSTYKKMLNERYGIPKKTLSGKDCSWINTWLEKNVGGLT